MEAIHTELMDEGEWRDRERERRSSDCIVLVRTIRAVNENVDAMTLFRRRQVDAVTRETRSGNRCHLCAGAFDQPASQPAHCCYAR